MPIVIAWVDHLQVCDGIAIIERPIAYAGIWETDIESARAYCDCENQCREDWEGVKHVFTYENDPDPLGRAKRDVMKGAHP